MPELLAVAMRSPRHSPSACSVATRQHTQRLIASEDLIVVGAAGMYEARMAVAALS